MSFSKNYVSTQMSELETINQPVIVDEMIISFEKREGSFGEYLSKNESGDKVLDRLIKHISMITEIANQYHESQHYTLEDNVMTLKPEAINRVTRVLLNEYAFYTSTSKNPLTLKEFSLLLDKIESLAGKQHNNLHLLLGTFSVIGEEGRLLNMSVYVECGKDARMHTFVKSHASVGTEYRGYRDFSRINTLEPIDEPVMASIPLDSKKTVPLESIFICNTEGGARFIVAIDICLDHSKSHSKVAFEHLLSSPTSDLLPTQISQVVISNTTVIYPDKLITPCVSHADAKSIAVMVDDKQSESIELKDMPDFKKITENYKQGKSLTPSVEVTSHEIKITNPVFGSNYAFRVYELPLTQKSSALYKKMSDQIDQTNQRFIQEKIKRIYLHNSPRDLAHQFIEAVKRGELHIVDRYLKQGMDVNTIDDKGRSLLHLAVQFRQPDMLMLLLKNDANADVLDEENHSLIYRAAIQSDLKSLTVLLKAGIPWDDKEMSAQKISVSSLIVDAIKAGNKDALKELLSVYNKQKGDVNALDKNGYTFLHRAVETGNESIVRVLLEEKDINIDQRDQFNKPALFNAIKLKKISVINTLLDHKADINIEINLIKNVKPDKKPTFQEIINRPLFAAITSESQEGVETLINKDGIKLNHSDSEHGITPMLYALNFMLDKAIQSQTSDTELESILHIVNTLLAKKAYLLGDEKTAKQDEAYINLLDKNLRLLNKKMKELGKERMPDELFKSIKSLCENSMHTYVLESAIRNKNLGEVNEIIQGYREQFGDDKTRIFLADVYEVCKQKYQIDKEISSILNPKISTPQP